MDKTFNENTARVFPFLKNSFLKSMLVALVTLAVCGSAVAQMQTILVRDGHLPMNSESVYTNSPTAAGPEDATRTGRLDTGLVDMGQNEDGDDTVGVVDWVEVQLRVVDNGGAVPTIRSDDVAKFTFKSGLLLSDGRIVDADTIGDLDPADPEDAGNVLSFEGFAVDEDNQDLYVAVIHRNHVPILSAGAVAADSDGEYAYDFTTAAAQSHNATSAVKQFSDGWSMPSGDADGDGNVNAVDNSVVILPRSDRASGLGYVPSDVDLNGLTNAVDVSVKFLPNSDRRASQFTY